MTTMRFFKSVVEEGAIIVFFITILVTFVLLGFFVVEKNVTDLLGVYETPSVVYFSQSIEEPIEAVEASAIPVEQSSDFSGREQQEYDGLNKLAKALEKKVEEKARSLILWCTDKIAKALEHLVEQIAKILQSS